MLHKSWGRTKKSLAIFGEGFLYVHLSGLPQVEHQHANAKTPLLAVT
jgi:hypothetical protein